METKIILAGVEYGINPLPFGKLRKVIAQFNVIARLGPNSDEAMEAAARVFAILIDKTPEEVDAMPISMHEMAEAIRQIPEICGLVKKEVSVGEPAAAMDSTASTVT